MSDKQIQETIDNLKELTQHVKWFRESEIFNMIKVIESLESVLHYPK